MSPAWYGFWYLIFPCGIFVSWLDRKLTARLQFRVGPPLAQPLWDVLKLMGKETIIPRSASRGLFIFSPLLGLSGASLAGALSRSLITGGGIMARAEFCWGCDSFALSSFTSQPGNYSRRAGKRKSHCRGRLCPGDEATFCLRIKPDYCSRGDFNSNRREVKHRRAVFSAQAKLSAVPFDLAEAETELSAGALIEYSGVLLGIYKLTRMIMLVVMPMFVVVLFWGGLEPKLTSIIWAIIKYLILLLVFVLLRNTNPRLRIDQALRFFWYGMGGIGLLAIILALLRW